MSVNVNDVLRHTDWSMLADQKLALITILAEIEPSETARGLEGILNWMDALQDAAEAEGFPVVWLDDVPPNPHTGDRSVTQREITKDGWRLVHAATGEPVCVGDTLTNFRGDTAVAAGGTPPRGPGKSGYVTLREGREYYPTVFDCRWLAPAL